MNTFKQTKSTIERVFSGAKNGLIEFAGWKYYIKFNTKIEGEVNGVDDGHLTINIPDFNLFVWKVDKYMQKAMKFYRDEKNYYELDTSSFRDKLFMCLLLNMSTFDAENIYDYITFRTKMLDTQFSSDKFSLGRLNYTKGQQEKSVKITASIRQNTSNLEATYKMKFAFENDLGERFSVPAVTFGIVDKKAYVYAVQRTKDVQEGEIVKELDRYFRKLNKGVDCEDIIANISPSSLVSLTLFATFLKNMGINKIVAKDFLPLRYMAVIDSPKGKNQEVSEKLDKDQFNMTNKFMYLFLRYSHHFENCKATYDDIKGEMSLTLNDSLIKSDNIIYQLDSVADEQEYSL
ncbi:MAG: hypothetical protein IJX25_00965 [Clostridia bacterium]|nr:hypothetical protein [Clostridia bacterium]MBQ8792422.1 hypothetical protein [Clostridia bacterium]